MFRLNRYQSLPVCLLKGNPKTESLHFMMFQFEFKIKDKQ